MFFVLNTYFLETTLATWNTVVNEIITIPVLLGFPQLTGKDLKQAEKIIIQLERGRSAWNNYF